MPAYTNNPGTENFKPRKFGLVHNGTTGSSVNFSTGETLTGNLITFNVPYNCDLEIYCDTGTNSNGLLFSVNGVNFGPSGNRNNIFKIFLREGDVFSINGNTSGVQAVGSATEVLS